MDQYIKIQKIISDKWDKEFPKCDEKDRFIDESNKEEAIKFFVDRLLFCDKITPQYNSIQDLTQEYIIWNQMADQMRMEIYKDAKKIKYYEEIEKTYLEKRK